MGPGWGKKMALGYQREQREAWSYTENSQRHRTPEAQPSASVICLCGTATPACFLPFEVMGEKSLFHVTTLKVLEDNVLWVELYSPSKKMLKSKPLVSVNILFGNILFGEYLTGNLRMSK